MFDNATPPQLTNPDAEMALLGSVIISPDLYIEIDITPEDFYVHKHRYIWDAIGKLHRADMQVDLITLTEVLDRAGKLADIGGAAYLATCIGKADFNVKEYARIIRDYSRRRAWLDTAQHMARLAYDKTANLENEAASILTEVSSSIKTGGAAQPISHFSHQVFDETFERMNDPQDIWGIPTGFTDFDAITGGLQPGEILNISGEPGVGKSIWAMQAGFQMAEAGYPGVIYSIEMPGTSVVRRRVSHMAKIPARAIKTGHMAEQFEAFSAAIDAIDKLPLYMSDDVQWTTTGVRADLARMKAQYGVQWFVLDYAYLLKDGIGLNENDRTGMISAQIKGICRGLSLAGIVILSLNKGGMGGVPSGENLRGNNQQFYDTDLLMFIIRPDAMRNEITCAFGKGRELETGKMTFSLVMLPGYPAFGNAAIRRDVNLNDFTR